MTVTGMWRFRDRLPVEAASEPVGLGEGDTPLLPVRLDRVPSPVWIKAEYLNPTGSYKDRLAAVALTLVRERGLRGVLGTSSGNGGAAAATYAARAGSSAVVLALPDAPSTKIDQILAVGAVASIAPGLGHDAVATRRIAEQIAGGAARFGMLPFLTGGRYCPEVMCGARTIAYELSEQAPGTTRVYVPVGGGGLYASVWRGYRDLDVPMPQLVAVQPDGCATVRDALGGGSGDLAGPTTTGISGLQVATLFDDDVVTALNESGGHLVEVTDADVATAQRILSHQGVVVEPAGACALAGALADAAAGRIDRDDQLVLIGTGAGWKDPGALHRLGTPEPTPLPSDLQDFLEAVTR